MTVTLMTMVASGCSTDEGVWLRECADSAAGEGVHVIFETEEFFDGRRRLYTSGGIVACLDWDDRLQSGAAAACEAAMHAEQVGLAFTWQRRILASGECIAEDKNKITRMHASSEPNSIHHLACIRSELVPSGLFDVIREVAPLCVDWIVKAYVALKYGAVQVPMVGYEWRQHSSQESRVRWDDYRKQVPLARALIRTWLPNDISQTRSFAVWNGTTSGG